MAEPQDVKVQDDGSENELAETPTKADVQRQIKDVQAKLQELEQMERLYEQKEAKDVAKPGEGLPHQPANPQDIPGAAGSAGPDIFQQQAKEPWDHTTGNVQRHDHQTTTASNAPGVQQPQ